MPLVGYNKNDVINRNEGKCGRGLKTLCFTIFQLQDSIRSSISIMRAWLKTIVFYSIPTPREDLQFVETYNVL